MVSFISESSLRGSWAGSVRLGWRRWWLKTFISLGFSILFRATKLSWLLTWYQFIGRRRITKSPIKGRQLIDYLDMPQILLFCTLWFSCLSFEFNKGLECAKSPMETIYYFLIWAIRESTILLSLLIVFIFLSFFLCHVIFAHDVLIGIFTMPMIFSPIFCLNHPFGFSI